MGSIRLQVPSTLMVDGDVDREIDQHLLLLSARRAQRLLDYSQRWSAGDKNHGAGRFASDFRCDPKPPIRHGTILGRADQQELR